MASKVPALALNSAQLGASTPAKSARTPASSSHQSSSSSAVKTPSSASAARAAPASARSARASSPQDSARSSSSQGGYNHPKPWRCCPGTRRGLFSPHPVYIPENSPDLLAKEAAALQATSKSSEAGSHLDTSRSLNLTARSLNLTARSSGSSSSMMDTGRSNSPVMFNGRRLEPFHTPRVDPKKFTKSVVFMNDKNAAALLAKASF